MAQSEEYRDGLEKYLNQNMANIKSFEFHSSFVYITMLDGTVIDMIATDQGSLEYDKYI